MDGALMIVLTVFGATFGAAKIALNGTRKSISDVANKVDCVDRKVGDLRVSVARLEEHIHGRAGVALTTRSPERL